MATLSIAKREFRSYFNSPVAYVVICLGLLALGLFFFNWGGGFWNANRATLFQLFTFLPWAFAILVVPVITMGLLAEERRSGTLEMLITLPVRDHEVVVGKFLGAFGLLLVLIAGTFVYPILMFGWPWDFGSIDSGPIASGYVGLILYSAAAVSVGLLVSSLTESQIIAFFITALLLVLLHVLGTSLVLSEIPETGQFVLAFVSTTSRLQGFVRGMINTRDVIYFLTLIAGCLVGSFWALERRKWA
jgi:ABC-2 type transport system permease protein